MSGIKELRALGAFVSDKPVRKSVACKIDDQELKFDIHVKRLSAGDYESLFIIDEKNRSRTAEVISKCVTLGEDGKERIKFEDAYKLHPNVAAAMVNAFNEVNAAKKS